MDTEHTDTILFPLNFGGYYAYRETDGKYVAYRLLDFNKNVLYRQTLKGEFDHKPTFEEVRSLELSLPIPQAATTLLRQSDLTLLGDDPLTKEDLVMYRQYLEEAIGMPQIELEKYINKIIWFSHEGTGELHLRRDPEDPQSFIKA